MGTARRVVDELERRRALAWREAGELEADCATTTWAERIATRGIAILEVRRVPAEADVARRQLQHIGAGIGNDDEPLGADGPESLRSEIDDCRRRVELLPLTETTQPGDLRRSGGVVGHDEQAMLRSAVRRRETHRHSRQDEPKSSAKLQVRFVMLNADAGPPRGPPTRRTRLSPMSAMNMLPA